MAWKFHFSKRLVDGPCKDIYFNYYLKICLYVHCLIKDRQSAEEITFNTLLQVCSNKDLHNEGAIPESVKQIATDKCLEHINNDPRLRKDYEEKLSQDGFREDLDALFNNVLLVVSNLQHPEYIAIDDSVIKALKELDEIDPAWHWISFKKQVKALGPQKLDYFSMAAALTAIAACAFVIIVPVVYYIFMQRQYANTDPAPQMNKQYAIGKEPELILDNGTIVKLDSVPDGQLIAPGIPFRKSKSTLAYVSLAPNDAAKGINILSIPPHRQYQITLADGSVIDLNASSQLHFPVNFSGDDRWVGMNGEAYFEVKSNPAKPFMINLGDEAIVKVTGTAFNINAYSDKEYISTTLVNGRLEMIDNRNSESQVLVPGQQANYKNGTFILKDSLNMDQVTAWKDGVFSLDDKTIREIMEEIKLWYNVKIIYKGVMPRTLFNGSVPRSIDLFRITDYISRTSGIKIRAMNDTLMVSTEE